MFSGTHLCGPIQLVESLMPDVTSTSLYCRGHIGLTLVIDTRPLVGTLARAACETLAHASCGTQLTWPTFTSSQRCPRTGRYSYIWIYPYVITYKSKIGVEQLPTKLLHTNSCPYVTIFCIQIYCLTYKFVFYVIPNFIVVNISFKRPANAR